MSGKNRANSLTTSTQPVFTSCLHYTTFFLPRIVTNVRKNCKIVRNYQNFLSCALFTTVGGGSAVSSAPHLSLRGGRSPTWQSLRRKFDPSRSPRASGARDDILHRVCHCEDHKERSDVVGRGNLCVANSIHRDRHAPPALAMTFCTAYVIARTTRSEATWWDTAISALQIRSIEIATRLRRSR